MPCECSTWIKKVVSQLSHKQHQRTGLVHGPTMVGSANAWSGAICAIRAARTANGHVGWNRLTSNVATFAQRINIVETFGLSSQGWMLGIVDFSWFFFFDFFRVEFEIFPIVFFQVFAPPRDGPSPGICRPVCSHPCVQFVFCCQFCQIRLYSRTNLREMFREFFCDFFLRFFCLPVQSIAMEKPDENHGFCGSPVRSGHSRPTLGTLNSRGRDGTIRPSFWHGQVDAKNRGLYNESLQSITWSNFLVKKKTP